MALPRLDLTRLNADFPSPNESSPTHDDVERAVRGDTDTSIILIYWYATSKENRETALCMISLLGWDPLRYLRVARSRKLRILGKVQREITLRDIDARCIPWVRDGETAKWSSEMTAAALTPVQKLCPTVRVRNCLENANIMFLGELAKRSAQDISRIKNSGRHSVRETTDLLKLVGMSFNMEIPKHVLAKIAAEKAVVSQ